jgi:hypothetical protein
VGSNRSLHLLSVMYRPGMLLLLRLGWIPELENRESCRSPCQFRTKGTSTDQRLLLFHQVSRGGQVLLLCKVITLPSLPIRLQYDEHHWYLPFRILNDSIRPSTRLSKVKWVSTRLFPNLTIPVSPLHLGTRPNCVLLIRNLGSVDTESDVR